MVPPIDVTDINSVEDAQKAIKTWKISRERAEFIAQALQEPIEKKEQNYEHLLNKPKMTTKDKANMEKSIKFLKEKKMFTQENLKKLERIHYGTNFIEIGGVKRTRENFKIDRRSEHIFKHWNEWYFSCRALHSTKESFNLRAYIEEKGFKLPRWFDFESSLDALPRWDKRNEIWWWHSKRYVWSNILWIILDLPMSGFCNLGGDLNDWSRGCVWALPSDLSNNERPFYEFCEDEWGIIYKDKNSALPIRLIFK